MEVIVNFSSKHKCPDGWTFPSDILKDIVFADMTIDQWRRLNIDGHIVSLNCTRCPITYNIDAYDVRQWYDAV